MTWKRAISEALSVSKHNDRRKEVTKLLLKAWEEGFFHSPTLIKQKIKQALDVSPFIDGRLASMKVPSTFSGVLNYLPLEVRVALLAHHVMGIGDCTFDSVLEAIESPFLYCLSVGPNYKFGWPAKLPIIETCEELEKTVNMAESNGISFDDAYEAYLAIVDTIWTSCTVDEARQQAGEFITLRVSPEMAMAVSLVCDEALTTSTADAVFRGKKADKGVAQQLFTDWLGKELSTPAPQPVAHTTTKIDPKMVPAINSLLASAGCNLTIENFIATEQSFGKLMGEADDLKAKLEEAERRAALAKSTNMATAQAIATDVLPSGQVVWKNAAKVFHMKGAQAKAMNFDVPTWEWDAPHPWVPQVDEDYIFDPKMLLAYCDAMAGGDPVWNYGHTGCGKTTFVEQVAARLCYPVLRVNCDSDIGRMDLVGRDKLTNTGGTTTSEFIDGIVPQALQHGCILLVDEFDAARNETAYVLQRVTEMKGLMIAEDGGRYVPPHPLFRIAACCNSRGQGDEFGIYPAVRVQSQAVLNRFTVWLEHDYLPADRETNLLVAKSGIADTIASKWVNFANGIREAFKRGDVLSVVSPRELVSACQRFVRYSTLMNDKDAHNLAMETTFLAKASGNDRAKFQEIAQRVFGY